MISTAAFRNRWRAVLTRSCVALARIEITSPSALTIYAATDEVRTPDGSHWEPLLGKAISISSPGGFLSSDVNLGTADFRLVDKRASFVANGETVSTVLANYDVVGATVTIILWERGLSSWEDRLERFVGVIQTYRVTTGEIRLSAIQPVDWNRDVTPRRITMQEYPQAPEESVGAALPTILGRIPGLPMRRPFAASYSDLQYIRELVAGGVRMAPGVLVDTGRGGGGTNPPARVLFAGHRCAQIGVYSGQRGTSIWLEGKDNVPHVLNVPPARVVNDDAGAGCTIPDGTGSAYAPIYPTDLRLVADYASNPRAILERQNEVVFARLDYTAGQRNLIAMLGSAPDHGKIVHAYAQIVYRSSAVLTGARFKVTNTALGISATTPISASLTESFMTIDLGTAWGASALPDEPWDFAQCELSVVWEGGGTYNGSLEVVLMGILVEYLPAQETLGIEKRLETVTVPRPRLGPGRHRPRHGSHVYSAPSASEREVLTTIKELRGKFYANVHGVPDDASGTYTGTALAVIERPCDVARYVLEAFAGAAADRVETGLGEFGSFVDARALLRTWTNRDMILGLHLSDAVDVQTVLGWIMAASASSLILSEYTGRWEFHPWRVSPDPTYTIPVSKEDLLDPDTAIEVELTPLANILSGLRVSYGYDGLAKTYPHECAISGDGSSGGHGFRNLRDAFLTVTAGINDKIDTYQASGGAITHVLAPGAYSPESLVSALKAAFPGTSQNVAVGGIIVYGVNDRIVVTDGTYKGVSIPAGTYSMENLAAMLQARIATVSTGWTVTYSRTSRKFTFARSSTPAGLAFLSGAEQTCAAVVGFGLRDLSGSSSYTSDGVCEEGLVAIAKTQEFDLRWRTGTNGLLGTKQTASEVLGFDYRNDDVGIGRGGPGYRHVGYCPKSALESTILTVDQRLGKRREVPLEGRALYDSETALEVRNRLVALLGGPRGVVTFSSEKHPDLRRGDVFEFAEDMDALRPYPVPGSGASWIGRRFRVLETHQRAGDSWHSEIVAVDVTD